MKALKVRPLKVIRPYLKHSEGSCLFQMGRTKVLCVATVEEKVPPFAEEKGIGWISGEYGMLPRAGEKRTPRGRGNGGGRAQEISRLIGRSLRAVVDMKVLQGISITIDCDVLQADGGTRTASINGGFICLVDALRGLLKEGRISQWPVKDYLSAVSVGLRDGRPLLDLDYENDFQADVDFNVVMTSRGNFVEIQGAAEGDTFSRRELELLLSAARRGIGQILAVQKRVLGSLSPQGKRKKIS